MHSAQSPSRSCHADATINRFFLSDCALQDGELALMDTGHEAKLDELDRLLNDPDVPMEPARIWSLLAEIARREVGARASGRSR